MTIYLDFDNVLADTTSAVLDLYNRDNNSWIGIGEITHYDFHDILKISPKKLWEYFNRVWDGDLKDLTPVDILGHEMVNNLISFGYDVEIVTGCGKSIVEDWLKEWLYPPLKVTYVKGGADKVVSFGDILVDDNPKHLNYAMENGCFPIVFDRPWNRLYELSSCDRIYDFRQFISRVTYLRQLIKDRYE